MTLEKSGGPDAATEADDAGKVDPDADVDGDAMGNAERGWRENADSSLGASEVVNAEGGVNGEEVELLVFGNALLEAFPWLLNIDGVVFGAILKADVPNAETVGAVCCVNAPKAEGAPNAEVVGALGVPNAGVFAAELNEGWPNADTAFDCGDAAFVPKADGWVVNAEKPPPPPNALVDPELFKDPNAPEAGLINDDN